MEEAAYAKGYSVLICNTNEDPDREATYLQLLHDENVAGIIFSPTQRCCTDPGRAQLDLPVVVIDRAIQGRALDMVVIDNVSAARQLTEHLIGNGYRRLAGLFGDASITGRERSEGFRETLTAHGLDPHSMIFTAARIEAGHEAALALFSQPELPDAILTSNSLLTAGVFQAIREHGFKVPDQMALAGFDVTEWGEFLDPPITVIAQPIEEIGCTATELLFQRIAEPEHPAQSVTLQGRLLVRGSSAPR